MRILTSSSTLRIPTPLLPVLIALLFSCTGMLTPDSAGGNTSTVDNKICGTVYSSNGNPEANASVFLRPSRYLAGKKALTKKHSADDDICSTTTDGRGRYSFTAAAISHPGTFSIEAVSSDGATAFFIDSIIIDSSLFVSKSWLGVDTPLYAATLQPPSSISGTITYGSNAISGSVALFGLGRSVQVDADGVFTLENIPCGQINITFIDNTENAIPAEPYRFTVTPDKSLDVGTLTPVVFKCTGPDSSGTVKLSKIGDTIIIPSLAAATGSVIWNSRADGTGTVFHSGDTIIVTDTLTSLYTDAKFRQRFLLTIESSGSGTAQGSDSVDFGVVHRITASPSPGFEVVWRITGGSARIGDSTALSTDVILDNGNATIEAVFRTITFSKTLFSKSYLRPDASCLQQSEDGGYTLGRIISFTPSENDPAAQTGRAFECTRITAYGDTIFRKIHSESSMAEISTLEPLADGGFVYLTPASEPDARTVYSIDITINRIDANGELSWQKQIGRPEIYERASLVRETRDGGFIIAGLTDVDTARLYVARLSPSGDSVWTRTLHYIGDKMIYSMYSSGDDGVILVFTDNSWGMSLMKLNAAGDSLWYKDIDEIGDLALYTQSSTGSDNPIFLFTEHTPGTAGPSILMLIKFDESGEIAWQKTLSTDVIPYGSVYLFTTTDGGCIFSGNDQNNLHSYDSTDQLYWDNVIFMQKIDSNGNTEWLRTFKFSTCHTDIIKTMLPVYNNGENNGCIFIADLPDCTESNILNTRIIKTDPEGIVRSE